MGNVICSLRRRLFAVLALTVLLAGVLLADVFVDLTVDPPEVLEDWPCVSDCRRDASGISFAIDDASCDLAFTFLGLPEDAEVCYLLHAGGQVVSSGYGTALPLADHPDADRVEFFSPDGSTDWGAVTSVAYDAEGRVLSETESGGPVSRRTVYAYAADTETADFTPVRTERYAGGVLVSTETYGREGSAASGLVERTTRSQQAGVGNVAFTESTDGVTVRTVDAGCVTNTVAYDAYRRTVATTDGRGNVTATAYDPFGRVSSVTDATNAVTRYVYDAMGRVAEVTNALGGVTFTRYDLRGNRTYEGGATYPVSYAYDVYGNRTSMTTYRDESETAGDTTTWIFDEATGLVTQKLYADGQGPCYTYTDDGKLATRTWARGVTTSYTYDAWGNLTSTTYSDGTPSVTFAYNALGRRTSVTDAKGTTVFTYDAFGDESQEAVTGLYSKTLVRHRDAYGRDLGHTMDGTRKNVIEYDAATGRIAREQLGGAWYAWSYLPGTSLKSSLSVGTAATTIWTYEPHRDLLTQVKNTVYGAVASQYDYANDALGRRTAIGRSGTMMSESRSDAYGYNNRNELVSAAKNGVTEYAYQYDDIGNRESSVEPDNSFSYSANELNQYTSILQPQLPTPTDFTPQYDEDGNQTLVKTRSGIWQVGYNGENRPVSWTCGATNLVMSYDHMGRRVEYVETVADPVELTTVTNRHQKFVYDKYLCIQRLNGTNNAVTDLFEWDPTEPVATRPLYWQPRTSQGNFSLFYTHDGNKNVSEAVFYQRARGVAAHYEYAPFGEVTAQTRGNAWGTLDLAADNPWRFSSEYADDATSAVYYNYRHYEPVMGRWISYDFLLDGIGSNLLAMSINNCLSMVDSLGLCCCGECEARGLKVDGPFVFGVRFVSGNEVTLLEFSMKSAISDITGKKINQIIDTHGSELLRALTNKYNQLAKQNRNLNLIANFIASPGYLARPQLQIGHLVKYERRRCGRSWRRLFLGCSWEAWERVESNVSEWSDIPESDKLNYTFDLMSVASGKDNVLGKIANGMKAILRREKSRKLEREIEVIDDCLVVP